MTRDIRFLPHPGALVEITQRTIQGRFLLRPSRRVNAIFVGCLARAQKYADAKVYAVAVQSNHFHALASFETVEHMSKFMCHLKTNLSKELGKIHDWPGPLWAGRFHSIPLSDEPEVQVSRLRYILDQGTKAGLVLSPSDWPGVHSAEALLTGRPLSGVWVDRTRLFAARQRNADVTEKDVTTEEELHLEPLPCWAELSQRSRRAEVASMLEQIERETLEMHRRNGTVPAGVEAIRRRQPHERPNRMARSPRPRFHAASDRVRKMLINGYREFFVAYRLAAEKLASGDRSVEFPENCYPPRPPFVAPLALSH